MRAVWFHFKAAFLNALTVFLNLFLRRDRKIWVFGSWMGSKFADNSRFLFQYLSENREKYGIDRVIWVARNRALVKKLRAMNYEAVLAGSFAGFFNTVRAGVHVVCNMPYSNGPYRGDINGNLSYGAVKIQLWHGFPIKANVQSKAQPSGIRASRLYRFSLPGQWAEKQYFVSTGRECSRRYRLWFANEDMRIIEAGYPRNCACPRLMESEQSVVSDVTRKPLTILYLPTFRSSEVTFPHPLEDPAFRQWLESEDALWIEKPHSAAAMESFFSSSDQFMKDRVMRLKEDFDINVLLPHVSLVVTDYSSVSVDAIYFDRPVVYYVPDIESYTRSDRGMIDGFESITSGPIVLRPEGMLSAVKQVLSKTDREQKDGFTEIKKTYFDGRKFSFEQEMNDILNAINKERQA
ncbi:MAG: CDP-glycerol glycerophosphotransferase family protein [Lachnospiraceae bacterium]|nr:CDP-glycerol glycerophosphotransferase family protein [Lachnospiraceae bacterium]